ncbi:MAG: hypothetical protein LBT45_01130 [Rickettsiales bacterium]|nr:hypothetical protein [Rickettsiales bacterium]
MLLFVRFRIGRDDLYLWLLLDARARGGSARLDDFRDKSVEGRAPPARRVDDAVLRELLGDKYYNSVKTDISKVEKIIGMSIMDVFDDNPVFARFSHLRGLARNREFEVMYYGKVR